LAVRFWTLGHKKIIHSFALLFVESIKLVANVYVRQPMGEIQLQARFGSWSCDREVN